MRQSTLLLSILALPSLATACTNVAGPCTKENLQGSCALIASKTEAQVQDACNLAGIPFSSLTQQGYQSDQNFLDGATTEFHKDSTSLDSKRGPLLGYLQSAHTQKKVGWPDYNAAPMPNFDLDTCQLETAMCCYTSAPTLSSNVCHHDIDKSRASSRLYRGFSVFDKVQDAYCVGFSWANSGVEDSFKGNLLADISYNNMMTMDGNAPGAPMCGCIEAMPTVTTAACRTVSVTGESYNIVADNSMPSGLLIVAQPGLSITYQDCGTDLLSHYKGGNQEALAKKLVGTCDTDDYLNDQFYVPGNSPIWDEPEDTSKWQKMMGQGVNYVPTKSFDVGARNERFMAVFNTSPNKIVYRRCPQCVASHKHIYYKRLTAIPGSLNFMDMLMNNFLETSNVLHVDFELYSTYEDAVAGTNPWQECEFKADQGLPGNCGPENLVHCQWNSHTRVPCTYEDYNTYSHAFYIEVA